MAIPYPLLNQFLILSIIWYGLVATQNSKMDFLRRGQFFHLKIYISDYKTWQIFTISWDIFTLGPFDWAPLCSQLWESSNKLDGQEDLHTVRPWTVLPSPMEDGMEEVIIPSSMVDLKLSMPLMEREIRAYRNVPYYCGEVNQNRTWRGKSNPDQTFLEKSPR